MPSCRSKSKGRCFSQRHIDYDIGSWSCRLHFLHNKRYTVCQIDESLFKGKNQSTDRRCRCICSTGCSTGCTKCCTKGRPQQLYSHARHGTKCCRCYWFRRSGRCFHVDTGGIMCITQRLITETPMH